MANLRVLDYYPPASGVSLPLTTKPWVSIGYNPLETSFDDVSGLLAESFFLEGPDTDQYVGPGLLELTSPGNISQGDLDNFLRSPGYYGIVDGACSIEALTPSGVKCTFNPSHALAPTFDYTAYLTGTFDLPDSTTVSGLKWPFQTGTGSIQELPSNLSTSILADVIKNGYVASPGALSNLKIVRTHPDDHSVENSLQLESIVVEFDKPLDPTSVTPDSVYVETLPVSDHPSAPSYAQGEIMTQLEVSGYQLKIKLL